MVIMFIPRHPVVQNQFCQFNETSTTTGVGVVLAYAGAVCYLVNAAANQDAIVDLYTAGDTYTSPENSPFGFLMQKVKTGYHNVHPAGFYMPGDLGSSDVVAQPKYNASGQISGTKFAPVGVAHLGIWDTVHYTVATKGTDAMKPGDHLYIDKTGGYCKVSNSSANQPDGVNTSVARVVKGASAAQVEANIDNTTLYPIRIKLLV
jgi:hypothetical protein